MVSGGMDAPDRGIPGKAFATLQWDECHTIWTPHHRPGKSRRPVGSFVAGNEALVRPRDMVLFSEACLSVAQGCMTVHESHSLAPLLRKGLP